MTKKRILSLFMALVMVFSLIPNAVLADVIKADEKSYDVYTFSVDGAKVQEQTVKVGDTLLEPAAPEKAGYEFTGWYNGGSRFTGFGSVTSVAGTTINLEAKFSEAHYVFFLDDTGRVYTTKQGVTGDVIKADVEFPTEVNESIVGWYTDPALTQKVASVTLAKKNIILYAKVAQGNYLTFDSTGGSYVEPQFVAQGANTAAPANPTRLGYTFSHWSETEGGSAFTFGSTITENKTLYAVWTASTNTKYTVIHWQENADDENYSYKESETKTGTSGAQSAASAKSYSGFTAQAITQQTIAGDGSTIVNVYYDRNEYTITFYSSNGGSATVIKCGYDTHTHTDDCYNCNHTHTTDCCYRHSDSIFHTCNTRACSHTHGTGGCVLACTAHVHSSDCYQTGYSITAKHGADISDQWPLQSNGNGNWKVSSNSYQAHIETMPIGGGSFYAYSTSSTSVNTVPYYVEALVQDGSVGTRKSDGLYYVLHHNDVSLGTAGNTVDYRDRYDMQGYTVNTALSAKDGDRYGGSEFYYTRNSYDIIFMSGGAVANTISKKYQADISSVSYTPTRPDNVPKGYVFVGWCSDAACSAPYTFSGTMPSQNITVYAKWAAPVFDATFYVDVNGTVVKVPYAEAIDKAQIPEVEIPAGYEFIGWTTTKNDLSTLFNLDTALYGDISLYPYFISTASFSVTYDLNGGSGSVSDSKVYAQDSHADVQSAAGISKANKVFLGWSYGGEIYYPGDKVLMPAANITLTAVWGDVLVTTSLTYKANGGEGDDVVISNLKNNELLKASDNLFTREGYTFLGWAKDAGAKDSQFKAGDEIRVDNGANVLYAVWQIDQYEVSYAYTGTVPAGAPDLLPTTAKHDYNSTVTVADEPTLDGYVFNGWYKDGAEVTSFTMPAKNVKLTGEWSIRTDLSYTVNYYWNGTEDKVFDSKEVDGCTFNKTYTESPIPIDGCTAVSQDSKSVTITTGENVINFYYYKNVTLTANSKTEVYDGSEKSVSGFTGAPEGAVFSTITVGAKGTVVGKYPAEFAEGTVGAKGTVDGIAKYIVTEAKDGKLTITPIETNIVVTADSASQTYDGTALTDDGYTYTGKLATGDKLTATVSGSQTDVGTADNVVVKVVITNQAGEDVTASYSGITTEKGTLTVTKRQVILTSEGGSKTYDGTPLTNSTVSVSGDGFVEGEVTDIKATGSVTNVDEGEVTNTITYTEGANFDADNYTITKNEGKLSITKRTVTLTSVTDSKEYDGTALTRPDVTVTGDGFVAGEVSDIKATGTVTYVHEGEVTNAITYTEGDDFDADNYTITKNEGKLSITAKKAPIVITAASDTKPYDGTALTNAGYTYTEGVLASGDELTATVAGTQTNAGTAANKVTGYVVKNAAGVEITTSYTFGTSVDGTLTVTQRPVTLTSETVSKIYDGTALTNSKVTVGGMGFVEGEVTDIKATGSVTHVAEGAVTNTIEFTPAEGFLADNYTITKNEGKLSIAARMVSLTSATASKVYDGKALTNSTVTVGGSGFVTGEGATYNVTGTQTQEGSSKNTFTYTLNKGTADTDYDITTQFGTLTVTAVTDKVTVTITENSGSEKYDGTEKTVTGYTVSIDNELYTKDNFTFSGNDTIKGTDAGSYPMELKPEDFTNTSKNFTNVEFQIVDGTLEIAKRAVTLTSADDHKTYDGTALTNDTVTVGGDGFAAGEGATYDVTGSQTEEGSSANTFSYTLNDGTKAGNYTITKTEGTLTVFAYNTEVVVTITENSGSATYDGTEKTVTGYTVSINNELYTEDDFTFSGNATIKGTDAGSYDMELKPEDFANVSKNFTKVVFVIKDGTLEIAKREVTLTSADLSKDYDGTALVNGETALAVESGFVAGEGATYTFTGSQLNVGSSANAFTYTLNEGTKADNYTITKTEGTLEVTPVTDEVVVTIKGNTDSKVYNGATQYVKGYQVTEISNPLYTVDNFKLTDTAIAQGKDIGTYGMGLSAADFENTSINFTNVVFDVTDGSLEIIPKPVTVTADNKTKVYGTADPELTATVTGVVDGESIELIDYTLSREAGEDVGDYTITPAGKAAQGNYTVTYDPGKLTITPVTDEVVVTITENSGKYTYDGTEKTVTGYEVTKISNKLYTVDDFTFSGNATVKGTYVGTYNMELKPADFKNISDNFTNVVFEIVDGTLVIDPIETVITITADSNEKVYDGTALTDDGYTFTQDVLVEGDVLTAVVEGTITDVGTTANEVTSYKVMRGEDDVTDCYTFGESVDGKLTITKKAVTLTSASDSKTYDGTALTNSKVTAEGFVDDEGATYDVTGSQTYVGTSDNTFTYTLNEGTSADNYDITVVEGKLTVTAITDEIVITADSDTKVYDGTALTDDGYTFTQDVLVEGDVLTAVVEGTITDVGTADNVVTSYKVMRGETDVTANYTFGESVDGTLTITKKAVTLTSASDSKPYDGTALTNSKVTAEGFVDDEGATYDVTGSQTYVGTSDNTFTYTLNEGTSADNYDITVVEGTLTVTAITAKIVITADSNTKVYDGTALTDDGYTYAEELLAEGDVIVAVVEGTITDAGSTDNVVTSYKVMRGETDVTKNYTGITTAEGTLTITKCPVTITSPDAEKVYDGTALVNTNVTSEGFVEGEGASYIVTGSQLNVGSSVNEFTYTLNEGTKADNYTVTVVKGTLTVTPVTDKVTVTITEHSGEEVYDGTEKTVEGYDVAIDNALYTEDDFAFEGNDSVSGIYAGTYDMELKPENFTNTSDNFTNVEFVIVDGALVIKPVETKIVITADSNEKVYDGTALTDDGYTYDQSLLVEGDYIVAVVEGSQTNVGSSANKVTSYQILRGANAAREIVDVTDCYANVTTVDGTLTVTKRPVVLTSGSDSKVYDGTALTKEVVTVSGDGWAAGEGAAYSEFASITNVGSVNNSFTYTLNEGTNAANYDITVVEGVLTVNKYTDAKLEATGYTGVYDGQLHDGVTDKAVVNGIEGDEWTYTYSIDGENFVEEMPQYQDVGTYTVYVKATNDNYEGDALTTTVPVVITPATIVVTADDHVIATGDPDPELTYQVSTPVETETPAFDGILVRQEGAAKGEYPIEQGTLVLVDGEGFKASNYVLEYVPGTLTILQRAIDVEKTVDVDKTFVGETITYTFVVTNTGEVDLQNVILIDEMLEIAGEIGALAIGETWTGKLTYVATKEDVGQTLYNTVIVLAEGDTYDEDTSEGTTVYEPVPDTGDHTPVAALSAAMLVSLAGVIVLLRKQRKESAE